jgi:Ca2+-binding RTX toxin-like protein
MAVIPGTSGNDSLTGGTDPDNITGLAGNDTLQGGGGNDSIDGGVGHDLIYGDHAIGVNQTNNASANWVEVTSVTQTIIGTNGQSNITSTVTSDSSVQFVSWSTVTAGFWISNGGIAETHTHTMSTQVAGAMLRLTATGDNEPIAFVIDGVTINLNDAITSGLVAFNNGGSGEYIIDSLGRFLGAPGNIGNSVATLTFNFTFTTMRLVSSASAPVQQGTTYEFFVNSNPPSFVVTADSLSGDVGNDTLLGGTGNDTLTGGTDNDSLDGGTGNDSLSGGDDTDTLRGGAGSDTLLGGAGNDILDGGAGDDDLVLGAGDSAAGGDGDDEFRIDATLSGTATITVTGGEAGEDLTDPTNGGTGDVLDLRGLTDVVITYTNPDPITGTSEAGTATYRTAGGQTVTIQFSQIERVLSSPNGVVEGTGAGEFMGLGYTDAQGDQVTSAADSILGNGGNDNIQAAGGNDTVSAGAGNDFVAGEAGDDVLAGDAGNDFLAGAAGNDSLTGGVGADSLYGGAGTDTLVGGDGNDQFAFGGADQAAGGAGDDVFTQDSTEAAINATIDGGDGTDTLDLRFEITGLTVTLGTNSESGTVGGLDADAGADITFTEVEHILTGDGDDTVDGVAATGPVSVDTGAGNDSLTSGSGSDSLSGGDGSDTLTGGEGADSLDGGAGDDDFVLGAGDSASGGDGDDEFRFDGTLTGTATITVTGGEAGEDLTDPTNGGAGDVLDLRGLSGIDIVWNTADPTWNGLRSESGTASYLNSAGQTVTLQFSQIERLLTDGDGIVTGTAGNDSLVPGDADAQGDRVDGWDGANDTIRAGAGDDTVTAGAGHDSVDGGTGNDLLTGGAGNDTLAGDAGDDTLLGGAGDLLSGGDGDDVFRFDRALTGATPLTVIGGQNAATGLGDVLSLQGLTSYSAAWTAGNKASGSGTLTYLNASGQMVTVNFSGIERVICFARDTLIATQRGEVAIQTLRLGDMILTADRGYQPMRWLAARRLSAGDLAEAPNLRPIRIRAGALGCGLPRRDLTVSPQHRILIRSKVAERMFGSPEVLIAAKQLLELNGVEILAAGTGVEYWHLMCDRHEVIFAEGLESETLFTGHEAMAAIPQECRAELSTLFPDLGRSGHLTSGPSARLLPRGNACRQLVHRHILNRKPMIAPAPPQRLRQRLGV